MLARYGVTISDEVTDTGQDEEMRDWIDKPEKGKSCHGLRSAGFLLPGQLMAAPRSELAGGSSVVASQAGLFLASFHVFTSQAYLDT
jgi:hypothetical protein